MKGNSGNFQWRDSADYWSTPVLANMLWVLFALPLVTLPLGMVSFLGVMFRWMAKRDAGIFNTILGSIRRNWWKAYALMGINLLVGGLVYINFSIFQLMDMTQILAFLSRIFTLVVAAILFLFNIYAWSLLSVWDQPFRYILNFSFRLIFARPLWSVIIGLAVAAPFIVTIFLPPAVLLTVTAALSAYIASRGTWFVIGKYVAPQDFEWIHFNR